VKQKQAFTLIELMIVLAIIALFIVFGAPAFNRYNYKQEVDTKAKEIKAVIDGAYVQSQYIQQGYDSILVTINQKEVISYFGNTNQCNITEVPEPTVQVEGISFSAFNIDPMPNSSGIAGSDDTLLFCFASSGLIQSYLFLDSANNEEMINPITNGENIRIKVSSSGYENYGFGTTPYLYLKNITNSREDTQKSLVTEIVYEQE